MQQHGARWEPAIAQPPALAIVVERLDRTLDAFLERQRADFAATWPDATLLVEEIERLVSAGGKRLRPAFCYWGFRAAGGEDGKPIFHVAAAIELLHTFALIHDDVMDKSEARRGVPTSHVHLAREHRRRGLAGDPERYGLAVAILAGDLAAVLADRLFLESGFPPDVLVPARQRYDRMRAEMAVGQLLDVSGGGGADERAARRVASLKTGSYSVEGPLAIGAILAGGSLGVLECLDRYGRPLGQAFQLRDDILDAADDRMRDEAHGRTKPQRRAVAELVEEARAAIDPSILSAGAAEAMDTLAGFFRLPGG